jgi:uncharacterized sulfatase
MPNRLIHPIFTLFVAVVLSGAATSARAATEGGKKNVLFIAVDDLNTRIGCYGDPIAKTPNIDRLAKKGVMFRRAYSQYPLCNPSRVSLMTGLRPDTTGIYDLETELRSVRPDIVTLPQLFRQNGYYVARVGKIYHYGVPREIGTDGQDDAPSWEYKFNPIGRDKTEQDKIHMVSMGGYKNTIGFSMSWLDMDGPDEDQTDAKGVTETIRLLEQQAKGGKPFFIASGFFRPHTPFIAPKKYFDLYPLDQIKLPKRDAASDKALPPVVRKVKPDDYGVTEKELKDCVRAYYASISFMDAQLGRLLDALDRLKLADDTLVVFWSDHGFLLGEHGQWQKQLLFDPSPHTPMIIYDPKAKGNGGACERTVELLDLYPTIAAWAGLKAPANLEGKDLRPLLDDPKASWDRHAYSQVTRVQKQKTIMGYSVHTERFRYTEWDFGKAGVELYDHEKDSGELHNLAEDPAHAKDRAALHEFIRDRKPNTTVKPAGGN